MKLLYATSIDLPSTRANRIQILSMAQAFYTSLGADFILGIAKSTEDTFLRPFIHVLGDHSSYVLAWKYLKLAKTEEVKRLLCREERLLFFILFFNALYFRLPIAVFYEMHHLIYLNRWWNRFILSRLHGTISITHGMNERLIASGYPAERTCVAPDAVDTERFARTESKEDARRALGLPLDRKIVMYVGTIDEPWKGADDLYEAACQITDPAVLVVLVGGKPHYVDAFNTNHPPRENVRLQGFQHHALVPQYLRAADIAVVPNSAKIEISRISTSPMKLFEYMAAGVPIVATDIPSLREVLTDDLALFVLPDNPTALADGITRALSDMVQSTERARRAQALVHDKYTWDQRAAALISFFASHA